MDSQFHPRFSFKAFTGYWDGHKDAQSSNTHEGLKVLPAAFTVSPSGTASAAGFPWPRSSPS